MNTNINRKQKYIKIASEILSREGRDGISIRRIASDAGCTSAVLYKHRRQLQRNGRLFGTDGVRGVANSELTPELAFKLGKAGALE